MLLLLLLCGATTYVSLRPLGNVDRYGDREQRGPLFARDSERYTTTTEGLAYNTER